MLVKEPEILEQHSKKWELPKRKIEEGSQGEVYKFFQEQLHTLEISEVIHLFFLEEFLKLKDKWIEETKYYSDPQKITSNIYYTKIIELGSNALPFIIKDLRENFNHWFPALEAITNANPIKIDHYGDIEKMSNDWIKWAHDNDI